MILLSFLLDRYLFPNHRRMDRTDHALRFTIWAGLAVLFLTLPDLYGVVAAGDEEASSSSSSSSSSGLPGPDFFDACSKGETDLVAEAMQSHPEWANARTPNGETCLHLAGIYGASSVTALVLEHGGDPNVRSTYEKGLRMHPLSWNVYGGHLKNIELLLGAGADVNLDFDSMVGDGDPVTPMDVLLELVKNEKGDDRFSAIEAVFRKHGAKTMEELRASASASSNEL
ncbi:unnamed protein product [Pseudo-nitzschia multistriata]|uniref:Uncharacterized protein n=1 Tax=Pseudo-nitzschia multistriata TaxID=183589 RepID=A0A448ZIS3_9STRA|nr:unnamed protein product [Pseudo-nitzschia multistriata]